MVSRTNARTLSSRAGAIAANGIVSANSSSLTLSPARYLLGSSAIVLMISMIVFSISCVDTLLAMYRAVAVSSSSAMGSPCAIGSATAEYRAWRERFRASMFYPDSVVSLSFVLEATHWMRRTLYLACRRPLGFDGPMASRFLTILTGRNLPKIRQPREPERSIITEKTIAEFTRVEEQTGILQRNPKSPGSEE